MTNNSQLRKDIINKFRTLSYFCELTGISYKKTLKVFNSDSYNIKDLEEIKKAYKITEVDKHHGLIRDVDRLSIRLCILSSFKSYSAFHRKYSTFDVVYLSNIIEGSLKKETGKYRLLIKLLTAQYRLDNSIWKRIKDLQKPNNLNNGKNKKITNQSIRT